MSDTFYNASMSFSDYQAFEDATVNDIQIDGGNASDTLRLKKMNTEANDAVQNIDIEYDGLGGSSDTLEYDDGNDSGNNDLKRVKLIALSDDNRDSYQSFSGEDYEIYLSGGWDKYNYIFGNSDDSSSEQLSSLEVWTRNVEIFALTDAEDYVDLRAASQAYTIYSRENDDEVFGSGYNDTLYAGTGNDIVKGYGGNDYIDGGDSSDTLFGGAGDDTIVVGSGGDLVSGGAGHDAIYATVDLTSNHVDVIYGDWVESDPDDENDHSLKADGTEYNEADVFILGYESISASRASFNWDTFWDENGADLLIDSGVSIVTAATGTKVAEPLISFGIDAIKNAFSGGSDARAMTSTSSVKAEIEIGDFDAWADLVVMSLGEDANNVFGQAKTTALNGTNTEALVLDYGGANFLTLFGEQTMASVMDGAFESSTSTIVLDTEEYQEILDNVYYNAVRIYYDGTEMVAETVLGVDMTQADNDDAASFDSYIDNQDSDEGVLLLGDYGGGTYFGRGFDVAGSNSSDVMYSGTYEADAFMSQVDAYSGAAITMYAGAGDDVVYGSAAGGDRLYGGSGNDFLHLVMANSGTQDYLYGGEDTDIASFARISGVNDGDGAASYGISVALHDTLTGDYGAKYAQVTLLGDTPSPIAQLYDIEHVQGTFNADDITGDTDTNILWGEEGNDTLDGNGGADTLFGGDGDDALTGGLDGDLFVFHDDSGSDTITDLGSGDVILFENASGGIVFDMQDEDTYVSYGSTTVKLEGVLVEESEFTVRTMGATEHTEAGYSLTYSGYTTNDIVVWWDLPNLAVDYIPSANWRTSDTYDARTEDDTQDSASDDGGSATAASEFDDLTDGLARASVSQSTTWTDGLGTEHIGYRAIDGDYNTESHTDHNDGDQTLTIALNGDAEIHQIDVYNRFIDSTYGPMGFNDLLEHAVVEVLDDGEVVWTSEGMTDAVLHSTTLDDVVGDAVRINGDDHYLHVSEVDIFGSYVSDVANLTDYLAQSMASQSTTWLNGGAQTHSAYRAIDNDFATESHTDHNDADPTLTIDLGGDADISEIDVYNRFVNSSQGDMGFNDLLEGAVVEVLNDGRVVWTSEGMTDAVLHEFDLTGVVGDTVRIDGDANYLHVSEVDVFGTYLTYDVVNLTDTLSTDAASQSSNYSSTNWLAANVLDGDLTNVNHTANHDASPWLKVDLGANALVDDIVIENRNDSWTGDRLTGAVVEVLNNDEVVWTSDALTNASSQTIDAGGVFGDAVRVNHENGDYIHLREIDIYGAFQDIVDLTEGLSADAASQSTTWVSGSSEGAHDAYRAIDGSYDTESHTNHNDTDQWLEIFLGQDAEIAQIDVYNRFIDSSYGPTWYNNLLDDAIVEVLDDGEVVWTSEGMTNAALHSFDLDGVVGDTVRIEGDDNYLHVSEVDIFGSFIA